MSSALDIVRDPLQVALLPKLIALEKDLQAFRAEVAQSNQELRAEGVENYQGLRAELKQVAQKLRSEMTQGLQGLSAEMTQGNLEIRSEVTQGLQGLRAEMDHGIQELNSELELKFSILLNEVQKIGIRTELTAEKMKAETETYVHRSITALAKRGAVLEMSLRTLKEKLERASWIQSQRGRPRYPASASQTHAQPLIPLYCFPNR